MAYYGQSPFCPFIMWFVLWPLLASPSGWPSTFIGILPTSSHLLGRSSSSIPLDPLHMITSPFSSARPAYNLLSCPHSPFSLSSYRGWKSLVSLSSPGHPCTTSLGAKISQTLDIWSSSDGHLLITYGFDALWSSCDSHHSSSIYQNHTLRAFRWFARGGHKDASRSCCSLGSEFSFHQALSIIPIR